MQSRKGERPAPPGATTMTNFIALSTSLLIAAGLVTLVLS